MKANSYKAMACIWWADTAMVAKMVLSQPVLNVA